MDEPKASTPPPSDSTSDEDTTRIAVNVNSASANSGAEADAITPPSPGQVVNADAAGSSDEAAEPAPAETEATAPADAAADSNQPTNQPAPTVINPGDAEPASIADESAEAAPAPAANPEPTITPAGMPAAPESPAPAGAQPPLSTDAPAAPAPQVVASGRRGGKGRWLKAFLLLVIIALLAAGGYFAYQKNHKANKPAASAASKDIPLLRLGVYGADFGGTYPDIADSDYSVAVNMQMFEGLVRYEDSSKIVPDLASTWTNPDSSTWIFTIKKGVKFHDGHTLTPADVKYSLDTMMNSTSDYAQTFAGTIASTQLVGSDQVKITTKAPDPTLLNKLTLLYIMDANLPKGDEPSLAGTGPYEVKPGTTPSKTNYQLVAFDQYHLGRPETRAANFISATGTDADLLKAFNNGQYDLAGSLSPELAPQAKQATLFHPTEADSNFIGFNTIQAGPLQNKLVREAIRYAVNAKAIGKANDESLTPVSQLVPPSIPGYNPAITPYKQNIAKAKQLLAQAGYPNGLPLRLSVIGSDQAEATEISNELKQVGITVTIDPHSDFGEFVDYFNNGQAEMYAVDYASDTLDAVDVYNSTLAPANYNNPKVTNLLAQANTTIDPATRLKLLQQVASLVDQDIPAVPLGTTTDTWAMNKPYVLQQDTPTGYLPVYLYTVHLK
ncbi:MAG TPA: ABC transporter substrate-binding protein [Candidatus Saccharimonadales bacterium]|nr:ABC transporter substrate-binding protein [Candidatus Saccharimonadales bacterium]